jgi:hypothetical protein
VIVTGDAVYLWDLGDVPSWAPLASRGLSGAAALPTLAPGSLGEPAPVFAMTLAPDAPAPGTSLAATLSARGTGGGARAGAAGGDHDGNDDDGVDALSGALASMNIDAPSTHLAIDPATITRACISRDGGWLAVAGEAAADGTPVARVVALRAGRAQTVPATWIDIASLDATAALSGRSVTAATVLEGHGFVAARLGAGGGVITAAEVVPPGAQDAADRFVTCAYSAPLSLLWLVSEHGTVALVTAEAGECVYAGEADVFGAVDIRGGVRVDFSFLFFVFLFFFFFL